MWDENDKNESTNLSESNIGQDIKWDDNAILKIVERYNEALLTAFKAKDHTVNLNRSKILDLYVKIERALIDSTKEIAGYRIEAYKRIIDGLNEQNRLTEYQQNQIITAIQNLLDRKNTIKTDK